MARDPAQTPAIDPKDGLRQRQRSDGTWRLWWEPTKRQHAAGARPVEFSARQPGHAQREATRLSREWTAAVNGTAAAVQQTGRSISALIQDYRASRHFTTKRTTTRASYTADLRAIEDKWGPQPVSLFDAVMMDQWYDALLAKRGVFRSRAILTMMRTLMKHAERRGWRPKGSNPCRDLEMERPAARKRVGSWAELDALLAATRALKREAPTDERATWRMMRLAIMLTAFGGQRQTDVLEARPDEFQAVTLQLPGMATPRRFWVWSLTRSKRLNDGQLALHPMIVPALRLQLMLAPNGPGTLIWDAATGNPFSKRLFWARWVAIRTRAAKDLPTVATIQWRDLRRTFGHLSRAGGADKGDVADVLGNTADTDATLAQVYMAATLATTWRAAAAIQRPAAPATPPIKQRKKA